MRLRDEFPVHERLAYLNAGTCGPVPRRAAAAAAAWLRRETDEGRGGDGFFDDLVALSEDVRARLALLLGCDPGEVALTRATTDGVSLALHTLALGPGDEVLTSDEEHTGLLAPLAAARRRQGFGVRFAPFAELAGEVGPQTRLVACSHVSWVSGRVVDTEALEGSGALVLLDGAQGLGAVPLDMRELGCEFYAASGQKWLCGPQGSGCLYVRSDLVEDLPAPWPGYSTLADASRPYELELHADARRFDMGLLGGPAAAWWQASLELFEESGWDAVHERAATLAERLAASLTEAGRDILTRGHSTLVSWRSDDPAHEVERLAAAGFLVRDIPGRGLVRASVGAWSSEDELDRLADLCAA